MGFAFYHNTDLGALLFQK